MKTSGHKVDFSIQGCKADDIKGLRNGAGNWPCQRTYDIQKLFANVLFGDYFPVFVDLLSQFDQDGKYCNIDIGV